ncbi:molybdopterin molybdotransferase MoeA [Micromonospora sp. MS34]|uniref:molybdopterin molybdotransferase MoeA n=1 Tax=Micromonospora sp. MS34 TaxID=3385971 RepID=UPI0039A2582D
MTLAVDGCRISEPADWDTARLLAYALPTPTPARSVPLAAAVGRTLAAPLRAAAPLPGFDNSAMDGYAVRGPGPWRVVGRVLAGCRLVPAPLAEQTAVEIATGAAVPDGTDRVVPYEIADRHGEWVHAACSDRRHIRRRAEYARPGQELAPAGTIVTPPLLGLAASVGQDALPVHAAPRARLLLTGDELVRRGRPGWGRVRDAIGPMMRPLLVAWGAELLDPRTVGDEPARFHSAVADSVADADLTVVCGASSVGPADGLHSALARLDAVVHVDGVACRPGHPQVLAQVGHRWIVGLPGNPYAALVAALTLVDPVLTALTGRRLPDLVTGTLLDPVRSDGRHTRIVPVRRGPEGFRVVNGVHPGFLGGAAVADAYAVVAPGTAGQHDVPLLTLP